MSQSAEAWQEQQELEEQAQQSEYELYYSIVEALVEAKKLGLSEDHLNVLRYATGIDSQTLGE
jgi:hypothetical protein